MSAHPEHAPDAVRRINGPRIAVALVVIAPLSMVWIARNETLSRLAKIAMIALATAMTMGQLAVAAALAIIAVLGALPPWFGTTLAVTIVAVVIALGGAIAARRLASSEHAAWTMTGASAAAAFLLIAIFGKPIQTVQAILFRVPMLTMAHALLDEDASYPTLGRDRPTDAVIDVRGVETPALDESEPFAFGPCAVRIARPFMQDQPDEAMLRFETSRGLIAFAKVTPMSERLLGRGGASGRASDMMHELFDFEDDYALAEAIYDATYDDVRAAQSLSELVYAESLYALKLFFGFHPPVKRFEGEGIRGFFSSKDTLAAADVFDVTGNHLLEVRVVALDVFADADLLEHELLRVLGTLRCE